MYSIIRRRPASFSTVVDWSKFNLHLATCSDLHKTVESFSNSRRWNHQLNNNFQLAKTARNLSTLPSEFRTARARQNASKDDTRDFMMAYPEVLHDLTQFAREYNTDECAAWFTRVLDHNLPAGNLTRGIFTVASYEGLVQPQDLKPENMRLAKIMGWCVELTNVFFNICDDILDNSTTRNTQICWHNLKDVGTIAVNDAFMVESAMYLLLKKHFGNFECYMHLVDLFHKASFITLSGQFLDTFYERDPVTTFTMQKYKNVTDTKTGFVTFYLSFALAAHLAGIKDPEIFRQSEKLLTDIAYYLQIQNDVMDCFGDQGLKVGTDIRDNKCSWLAVTCMQQANEKQKQIMLKCYGKNDSESEAKVKELYQSLELHKAFAVYEEETCSRLKAEIEQLPDVYPHRVFLDLLQRIKDLKY